MKKEEILPSEVISSDDFRIMVSDVEFIDWHDRPKDEADSLMDEYQTISGEAFSMMESVIEARCRLNKLTIIDATNLHPDDRKKIYHFSQRS
ncbi:hypothetical protein RCO48_23420 [Peribacillus frigoritolerans]|nr:hypothetical protein [Peribacillus frigoritolerans]